MTPERWQKINEVFQSAVELDSVEQEDFLKKACADDESLRQQVETLLAANADAGTFIAGNAANDVAHLLTNETEPNLIGETLEHYEIISILGTGGMGKVYLAKDSKLNRSVAVKTLPAPLSKEPNFVRRFQTEAKAAATLNHPNVATIYSVEETDESKFFITMEYVEGKPLNSLIPANGLDTKTFLEWFIALADALALAHEKGVIHRDIKPGNLMIAALGVPKILDFGLARINSTKISNDDSTLHLTKTGQVLGTPAYMSPEQAEGKQADHRSDIFSFGVVMYEAITGEKPFKGDNYASIVSDLMTKDPPPVAETKPEVPYLISRVIMKCLNKEPRHRYQSMKEVLVLLRETKSAVESGASLSKPGKLALSSSKTFPTWLLIGAVLLLVVIGSFVLWNIFKLGGTQTEQVARFHVQPPSENASDLFNVKITPDGRHLVFPSKKDGVDVLMLRPLDKYQATQIEGTEQGNDPIISPDGKWLAFRYGLKAMKKVPLTGGVSVTICDSCDIGTGGDWGEDNMIVFSDKTGLFRISADGGKLERLTTVNTQSGEKSHISPEILPGGKGIIFTVVENNKRRLAVLSTATNKRRFLEIANLNGYPKYLPTGHLLYAREEQIFAVPFDADNLKVSGNPISVLEGVFSFLPEIQISDTGTLIYLPATSLKNNSLVWVDKTGKDSPALKKSDAYFAPQLSKDGKKVAVAVDGDIWIYDLESERGVRLTTEGKSGYPLWTSDGEAIIYMTETENNWTIYRKNASGAGTAEKIFSADFRISPYSIHPTEPIVLLAASPSENLINIIALSLNDGTTKTVVESEFAADMPKFSPDGKWFAYYTTESGKNQIFIQPWKENTADQRFLVSKQAGLSPVWSKDGRKIYYRTISNFYEAEIQTVPEVKAGEVKLLFEGNYRTVFDVSPDGNRFLMVKSDKGIFPKRLNVVTNWLSEFEQKIKSGK